MDQDGGVDRRVRRARINMILHRRRHRRRPNIDFSRDLLNGMAAGYVHLGRGTYGRPSVKRYNDAHLRIGQYTSIADEVQILLGGEHPTGTATSYPFHLSYPTRELMAAPALAEWGSGSDTVIGSDVWLGRRALILGEVNIGDGAVVAAGAVVAGDIEPYSIVGGVPARVIRMRYENDVVKRLLALGWWDWPFETVLDHALLLMSPVGEFLTHVDAAGDGACPSGHCPAAGTRSAQTALPTPRA